ncbi:hypothetical protein [Cerasicoccus frondis]|uniref:hypothetical protein n=1 Tax=Cerasicoccus frondis TaxID=490090 RepID=UPI0028527356|nr:hypothetical protein [Cerasicoccus frondis]
MVIAIAIASLYQLFRFSQISTEKSNLSLIARLAAEEALEDAFWSIREGKLDSDWTLVEITDDLKTYQRVDTEQNKNNRSATITREVTENTITVDGDISYIYGITVSVLVDGAFDQTMSDGFELKIENLATLPELAAMRIMDNARSNWRFDQIGSYDSSIDQITGEQLYSYDNNLYMGNYYSFQGGAMWDDTGFKYLPSYEALEIFVGTWGHSNTEDGIPYVSYFSRDLEADGGESEPINVYYTRRSDVEKNQYTTLTAGDGKDFFDFITGANETESNEALLNITGSTDFDVLESNSDNLAAFLEELTSNDEYSPDTSQYNFIEVAGLSPSKTPFTGVYEDETYYGGEIKLNSLAIDTSGADATPDGVTVSSIAPTNNANNVLVSGGDADSNKAVVFHVKDSPKNKRILIDSGSNVILYINDVGVDNEFETEVINVLDGGKLTVHLGPDLNSFNAKSAAVPESGNPQDLVILDEPLATPILDESGIETGEFEYIGTNIALGDPYRDYEPYKALNLDNANHPTVAVVYAPYSTVYTDHIAGAVVSDHFQSHGVIMLDRYSLNNNFYLNSLITNANKRYSVVELKRTKGQ